MIAHPRARRRPRPGADVLPLQQAEAVGPRVRTAPATPFAQFAQSSSSARTVKSRWLRLATAWTRFGASAAGSPSAAGRSWTRWRRGSGGAWPGRRGCAIRASGAGRRWRSRRLPSSMSPGLGPQCLRTEKKNRQDAAAGSGYEAQQGALDSAEEGEPRRTGPPCCDRSTHVSVWRPCPPLLRAAAAER